MFPIRYSSGEIPAWQEEGNPWAMATQSGFARSTASKIETLFSLEQDLKFLTPGLKIKGTFSFDRYSTGKVTRSKKIEYWNAASGRNEEGELILAQNNKVVTSWVLPNRQNMVTRVSIWKPA